jgi:hypothetical protein
MASLLSSSNHCRVKPKNIKLRFVASPLSTQYYGVRAKKGWINVSTRGLFYSVSLHCSVFVQKKFKKFWAWVMSTIFWLGGVIPNPLKVKRSIPYYMFLTCKIILALNIWWIKNLFIKRYWMLIFMSKRLPFYIHWALIYVPTYGVNVWLIHPA